MPSGSWLVTSEEVQATNHKPQTTASFVARRFATKEAAAKALGTGIGQFTRFKDIETVHDAKGKPSLIFHRPLTTDHRPLTTHLSVSDDYPYATATVILESR